MKNGRQKGNIAWNYIIPLLSVGPRVKLALLVTSDEVFCAPKATEDAVKRGRREGGVGGGCKIKRALVCSGSGLVTSDI